MNIGIVGLGHIGGSIAGKEVGGFKNSTAYLFAGASMILVPGDYLDALRSHDDERLRELLRRGRELKEKVGGR